MLLESFLACLSLATVMILAKPSGRPDLTYADGVAVFMNQATFGLVSVDIARQFGLLVLRHLRLRYAGCVHAPRALCADGADRLEG